MSKVLSRNGFRRLAATGAALLALGAVAAPAAAAATPVAACTPVVLKKVVTSPDSTGVGVAFTYSATVTEKNISYLPAGEKPTQDGSGDPIAIKGNAFIRVIVSCYNWTQDTYRGPKRLPGEGAVKEIVLGGTFEGQQTWYIGVDRKRAYDDLSRGASVSLKVKV
ncbi:MULTISPECIES: hypothetical protein [unclassified Crossiella]|uniref:AMIN-like domain-containing (lipo)protein n=1 Tax=unclassified Crossiella TaxID=2620835 RepID=UPI001FFE7DA1|nr:MULTISPECIES: hypothetical protein [unclassified Crossiella]MCK2245328.1 hypothetical protein [Crossiella sp. S99.2]MCK2258970.1 hypothetical protein [Crossiella sp. S99.1]